jgi:hypothetical protein
MQDDATSLDHGRCLAHHPWRLSIARQQPSQHLSQEQYCRQFISLFKLNQHALRLIVVHWYPSNSSDSSISPPAPPQSVHPKHPFVRWLTPGLPNYPLHSVLHSSTLHNPVRCITEILQCHRISVLKQRRIAMWSFDRIVVKLVLVCRLLVQPSSHRPTSCEQIVC